MSANCAEGTREDGDNESVKGGEQWGAVGGWREEEKESEREKAVEGGQLIIFPNYTCPSPASKIYPCDLIIGFDWLNKEK